MSDSSLKSLVAATCFIVIAAVGWFTLNAYQQSQTSDLDKKIAEQYRLAKELQGRFNR